MTTPSSIGVDEGSTKYLDTTLVDTSLPVGQVHREGNFIADPADAAGRAAVQNSDPSDSTYGVVVRDVWTKGIRETLLRILSIIMAPLGYNKVTQRYQATAIVESGTVTTVSTVTTVTGVTNLGIRPADMLVLAQTRTSWALNVRSRIT